MAEKEYKRDEDGHYIIAENVPFVFSSVIKSVQEKKEVIEKDADKKD